MLKIGIDPGANTGFCVFNTKTRQIQTIGTTDFWSFIDFIQGLVNYCKENNHNPVDELLFVIENPNLNKPVFTKRYDAKSVNSLLKVAQNVGENKRDAKLLISYIKKLGFKVREIKPVTSKWDEPLFRRITKYQGSTSEHARDAAKLVYGV